MKEIELGNLIIQYSAEYIRGEEEVGIPEGWDVTIHDVSAYIESPYLKYGSEVINVKTYEEEEIERDIIKHIER